MPMEQARRLCPPSTVVVVPRFAAYAAYSARIMAALREVTDLVEPVSIDEAFAAGARTRVLCNPHNPTGTVADRAELEAIAEIVERHGGRVFADEIHAPLRFDGRPFIPYASVSEATAAHTITGTSASKAWNIP